MYSAVAQGQTILREKGRIAEKERANCFLSSLIICSLYPGKM
jgi:hypothetical protein